MLLDPIRTRIRPLCGVVAAITLALALTELWIEWRERRELAAFAKQVRPFYSWSFEDSQSRQISHRTGYLRLRLDPEVGYRNVPNQHTPYFTISSEGARGVVATDSVAKVLVSGGSFAFGTGLSADEETFAMQMQQKIPQISVTNIAVIGFASAQEDLLQREWLSRKKFELVVSVGGWNDFHFYYRGISAPLAVHGESSRQIEDQLQLGYALSDPNPLFRALAVVRNAVFPKLSQLFSGTKESGRQSVDVEPIVTEYVRRIQFMKERCAERQIPFLLVLQPDNNAMQIANGRVLNDAAVTEFATHYLTFVQQVVERAKELKIDVLDLNRSRDVLPGQFFMDAIHLDAQGNAAVANLLVPEFKRILSAQKVVS